jgi:hypothetical protein
LCTCLNQQKAYPRKLDKWETYLGVDLKANISFVYPQFHLSDPYIIGLIDGDGCFCINFNKSGKLGFLFQITGDKSQLLLFSQIQKRLGCGTIQTTKGKNIINFKVNSRRDMVTKII